MNKVKFHRNILKQFKYLNIGDFVFMEHEDMSGIIIHNTICENMRTFQDILGKELFIIFFQNIQIYNKNNKIYENNSKQNIYDNKLYLCNTFHTRTAARSASHKVIEQI